MPAILTGFFYILEWLEMRLERYAMFAYLKFLGLENGLDLRPFGKLKAVRRL